IRHKMIICEPMLEQINLEAYLDAQIKQVAIGGESGPDARLMRYQWALDMKAQCERKQVPFCFRQTGARFEKDGKIYSIPRKDQMSQARKAGL
ncbi:MAG: DUF5131 family protein, partial [Clostridia bacterium]